MPEGVSVRIPQSGDRPAMDVKFKGIENVSGAIKEVKFDPSNWSVNKPNSESS